ncbi:hypothetical protein [Desulfocicer niacini]
MLIVDQIYHIELLKGEKKAKKLISDDVRKDVADIVEKYNQKELSNLPCYFVARFQGRFL